MARSNPNQPLPIWVADPGSFGIPVPLPVVVADAQRFAQGLEGLTDFTGKISTAVDQAWQQATTGATGTVPPILKYIAFGIAGLMIFSVITQARGRR